MKRLQLTICFGLMAVMLGFGLQSCKKVEEPEPFHPDRMFTPTGITATGGETQAKITWKSSLFSSGPEVSYTMEISPNADFSGTPAYTNITNATEAIVTDAQLTLQTNYYARVKANSTSTAAASNGWVATTTPFMITGEQLFLTLNDADITTTSVRLKWRVTPDLTKITITPTAGGAATDHTLTPADLTAGEKMIGGLTPTTDYKAELFKGAVTKGIVTFTTKTPSIYTVVLTPADDLVAAVAAAANGDVIGLDPGTYNCKSGADFVALVLQEKTITIQSTSGNPANTKVNYREITLKGTGAGITLKGIEFDGAAANATGQQALYFLNMTGATSDGGAAVFTNIIVDNCIIHDMGNCILRGNRAAANDHKIGEIKFNNSILYNSAMINSNYTFLQINKLDVGSIEFTNSTLRTLGRGIIDWDAAMSTNPGILFDKCTINNFGQAGLDYFMVDLNANAANLQIRNSIIANAPMPGQTTGANIMRIGSATASMSNSNTFNLTNGASPAVPHTFPGNLSQTANTTADPGWTATTTDFTLPAASPFRTASNTGGPIGDPRWAN